MDSFKDLRLRLLFDYSNDSWRIFMKNGSISNENFDSVYDALNYLINGN